MAETNIVYDYEINQVRIFTDRAGVASQILTRSNHQAEVVEMRNGGPCGICKAARVIAWDIRIPMHLCRGAYAITKVLGEAA